MIKRSNGIVPSVIINFWSQWIWEVLVVQTILYSLQIIIQISWVCLPSFRYFGKCVNIQRWFKVRHWGCDTLWLGWLSNDKVASNKIISRSDSNKSILLIPTKNRSGSRIWFYSFTFRETNLSKSWFKNWEVFRCYNSTSRISSVKVTDRFSTLYETF